MQVPIFSEPWLCQARAVLQRQALGSASTLLVYGPLGLGLLSVAQHWAQTQLCENPQDRGGQLHPCGQCHSCLMVHAHQHPDLQALLPASLAVELGLLEPSKKEAKPSDEIRIDDLRALQSFFNISSSRGARRYLLVYPFEALNANSANAFLKTLEEPSGGLCVLLLGQQPAALLPTVRSRCRRVALPGPTAVDLMAWWSKQGIEQPDQLLALLLPTEINALWLKTKQERHARLDPRQAWVEFLAAGASGSLPSGSDAMGLRVAIVLALRVCQAWLRVAVGMPPPQAGEWPALYSALLWAKGRPLAPCLAIAEYWQRMLRHADHPIGVRLALEMMAEQWHTLRVAS